MLEWGGSRGWVGAGQEGGGWLVEDGLVMLIFGATRVLASRRTFVTVGVVM